MRLPGPCCTETESQAWRGVQEAAFTSTPSAWYVQLHVRSTDSKKKTRVVVSLVSHWAKQSKQVSLLQNFSEPLRRERAL